MAFSSLGVLFRTQSYALLADAVGQLLQIPMSSFFYPLIDVDLEASFLVF
jgi:hypothetical protein